MESSSGNNNASVIHPIKSELSVNKESENIVTLVHTVSFYRRQQSANVSFFYLNLVYRSINRLLSKFQTIFMKLMEHFNDIFH